MSRAKTNAKTKLLHHQLSYLRKSKLIFIGFDSFWLFSLWTMSKKRFFVLCYDYQFYPEPIEIMTANLFVYDRLGIWNERRHVSVKCVSFQENDSCSKLFFKTRIGHLRVSEFLDNNGPHDVIIGDILILISGFVAPNSPLHHVS